jgi:hypothetical protein
MKRKHAAMYLSADVALFAGLLVAGASAWALVALVVLALPVAVLAILPEVRDGARTDG